MATITLGYTAGRGLVPSAAFVTKFGAIPVLDGELDLLGMSFVSSATVAVPGGAQRTIVLNVDPTGEANFPTNETKIAATTHLYTQALAMRTPARVVASTPVIA